MSRGMVTTRNPPCWAHSSTEFWIRLSLRSITERDLPHARCNYSKEHDTSTTNTNTMCPALGLSIQQLSQLKLPPPTTRKYGPERLRMSASPQLVSKSLAWEFIRVFCADVHVFTPSHLNHVIGRLLQLDTVAFRSTDSSFTSSDFSFHFLCPRSRPLWLQFRNAPGVQTISFRCFDNSSLVPDGY
ncbi:hypothetical protein ARMSODRAFT_525863 [Armillaria solidipes]|uniref:Uncharacterized protein n=1 Tax=Armillaria solidipes TaxID=1076256 RepID=A0A2H3BIV1_9AGAR|nr:hypothetical protein ARMSODRAFT_525863 [Armillaria solidipes]